MKKNSLLYKIVVAVIVIIAAIFIIKNNSNIDSEYDQNQLTTAAWQETQAQSQDQQADQTQQQDETQSYTQYYFRNNKLLYEHYEKHGKEMGFASAKEYEAAASDVINNPDALFKIEAEDGDGVYYVEATNDFVIFSTDGYIRTYFHPNDGIDYFNRQ